ncbi:MAG: type III pantothenate kinase [Bacteroidia bacterium]|nr:type III pantothenate kinase [Bacteroidia bacterium]
MNLTIDIGNSAAKLAVFDASRLVWKTTADTINSDFITGLLVRYPLIDKAILVSVAGNDLTDFAMLKNIFRYFIYLGKDTLLPISNEYQSKETLGYDRIAAVAGARHILPGKFLLVIDAGSALTFDFIDGSGKYLGGNISPGISMRFKALNSFTGKLPLVGINDQSGLIGTNTEQALVFGVQNGVLSETEKYIDKVRNKYPDCEIVVTGGDCGFFEKHLKRVIFVEPDLVMLGLNEILVYNIENK